MTYLRKVEDLLNRHYGGWLENGNTDKAHCPCGHRPASIGESHGYHVALDVLAELGISPNTGSFSVGEMAMHHGEATSWIAELESFIREHGLKVPSWADRVRAATPELPPNWEQPKQDAQYRPFALAPNVSVALCTDCGVLVGDAVAHNKFHDRRVIR